MGFLKKLKNAWCSVLPTVTVTIRIFFRETNGDFHLISVVFNKKTEGV